MWMCDRCQEINDDNVNVCPKCGFANRPTEPSPSVGQGANTPTGNAGFDYSRMASTGGMPPSVPVTGRPPGMWQDMRLAISKSPLVGVVLALLLVAEFAPAVLHTPVSLFVSIPSALLLAPVIVASWKLAYLRARGVRAVGVVVDRRDTPAAWKTPPRAWSTIQYTVNGCTFQIKDTYGGHINNYPHVGDQVQVICDGFAPSLAYPDVPTAAKWVTLVNMALFGLFLFGLDWCIHYAPGS